MDAAAVLASVEPVSYRIEGDRTVVPLKLEANGSVFVVFRKATIVTRYTAPLQVETSVLPITGRWNVAFRPSYSAPPMTATLDRLGSWCDSTDPAVKYFSGTATYTRTVDVTAAWINTGTKQLLDLGEVRDLAEVSLNGKSLGTLWNPPYRIDVTGALKPGSNTVEVKVTNLWVNRLIGDQQPGATKYAYTASFTYKPDAPLRPSGLLGPVRIISSVVR